MLGQTPLKNGAFNLQPLHSEGSRKNSKNEATLSDWMRLPFSAPDHVVLAGLNSIGGASGLSRPDGSEMFFTATSVMAAGGRSVAMSRWNAGGKTQVKLAAKFARYAVAMPVTTALQSAVKYVRSSKVDLMKEPRCKTDPAAPEVDGDAPFFWAGLMVVSYDDQRAVDPAVLAMADKPAAVNKPAAVKVADPPIVEPVESVEPTDPVDPQPMANVDVQPPPPEKVETAVVDDSVKETSKGEDADQDDDDEGGAVWKIGGKK